MSRIASNRHTLTTRCGRAFSSQLALAHSPGGEVMAHALRQSEACISRAIYFQKSAFALTDTELRAHASAAADARERACALTLTRPRAFLPRIFHTCCNAFIRVLIMLRCLSVRRMRMRVRFSASTMRCCCIVVVGKCVVPSSRARRSRFHDQGFPGPMTVDLDQCSALTSRQTDASAVPLLGTELVDRRRDIVVRFYLCRVSFQVL